MRYEKTGIPEIDNDPVFRYFVTNPAATHHEAEEMYLNDSLPQVLELLAGPLSDEELADHPLLVLLRRHGSRGREDSLR
jgi:hypothetical protein